ncbi:MAG: ComEA family DNA-binding protein [Myxococcota bacterium]
MERKQKTSGAWGARRTALGLCAVALGLSVLTGSTAVLAAPDTGKSGAAVTVVNVNAASVDELQVLPGIGESRARAIVERRRTKGAFESVEQLAEIRGIGSAMVERLRPLVTLRGPTRTGSVRQGGKP